MIFLCYNKIDPSATDANKLILTEKNTNEAQIHKKILVTGSTNEILLRLLSKLVYTTPLFFTGLYASISQA